jgi:AraC-like DNA-binding protein
MVAQGSKEVLVGESRYRHDPAHYLLITVELPVVSWVLKASREQPYLSLHLDLDMTLVRSVAAEAELSSRQEPAQVRALNTGSLDAGLLDAVVRLVRLLEAPVDAKVLAPLITREIIYRLLLGERGGQLRRMAGQDGDSHHIARAAEQLRKNLDHPLRVEDVAKGFGMSVSSFHSHFKAVIGLSPLQFQKRMRLQEARRLMLYEALDAAGAGYQVGYDDAAHFSREYKSLFGVPPKKDVERLREVAQTAPG